MRQCTSRLDWLLAIPYRRGRRGRWGSGCRARVCREARAVRRATRRGNWPEPTAASASSCLTPHLWRPPSPPRAIPSLPTGRGRGSRHPLTACRGSRVSGRTRRRSRRIRSGLPSWRRWAAKSPTSPSTQKPQAEQVGLLLSRLQISRRRRASRWRSGVVDHRERVHGWRQGDAPAATPVPWPELAQRRRLGRMRRPP